jgi:hypothetical protein
VLFVESALYQSHKRRYRIIGVVTYCIDDKGRTLGCREHHELHDGLSVYWIAAIIAADGHIAAKPTGRLSK